jgi:hypothetical protein
MNAGLGPFCNVQSLTPHILHVLPGSSLSLLLPSLAFSFAAFLWPPPCQPDSRAAVCGWVRDLVILECASYFSRLERSFVEREAGLPATEQPDEGGERPALP